MHDFQGYFSRTLSFNFQDFPGPGIFKKKIQDFPGGVGTLFLSVGQLYTKYLHIVIVLGKKKLLKKNIRASQRDTVFSEHGWNPANCNYLLVASAVSHFGRLCIRVSVDDRQGA